MMPGRARGLASCACGLTRRGGGEKLEATRGFREGSKSSTERDAGERCDEKTVGNRVRRRRAGRPRGRGLDAERSKVEGDGGFEEEGRDCVRARGRTQGRRRRTLHVRRLFELPAGRCA